ncbi:SCO family protein [Bacillus horti]|uniref:Protein SCO1/2 n=1 Tax=Caldalkalibacillus horti TaxID=77523 RepID=A0ABT9VTK4_9BACI|nr:SCO family protein [Bacillus horti]MDQ0164209.1 protein SCO1/2 [Bacillus horti]
MMAKKGLLFLGLLLILTGSACSQKELNDRLDYTIQNFQFENQDREMVALADLEGKVWIANFIFTNCDTVCPISTSNMATLQKELKKNDLDVSLVSFSVDPENDKPEVLRAYGENYQADFSTWDFLTGYGLDEIQWFAEHSFRTIVQQEPSSNQILHGTQFFLIDQEGKVARHYSGLQDVPMEEIIKDSILLVK